MLVATPELLPVALIMPATLRPFFDFDEPDSIAFDSYERLPPVSLAPNSLRNSRVQGTPRITPNTAIPINVVAMLM